MNILLISLCAVATIAAVSGTDYCDLPCFDYRKQEDVTNIGCNHNKQFSRKCPGNAKMLPISPSDVDVIVHEHNVKRNLIAGGGDPNHSRACRMATMKYDPKLAELAGLNTLQCEMEHDKCHKTPDFEHSGQNLYVSMKSPPGRVNLTEELKNAVNSWYSEVEYSYQSYIDSYPKNYPSSYPDIGHFTVMVADRNMGVGCGASTYVVGVWQHTLISCNYATTNMIGHPIYVGCKQAATSCKTGTNPEFPNLCSTKEKYDVNNFF